MPTESLILRRVIPVPVTFADLRRAYNSQTNHGQVTMHEAFHIDLKDITGAIDEVYAVIDGHEVRVAIIEGMDGDAVGVGPCARAGDITNLLIKADEAGYWQRPHEVVHHLEESQMSHKTMRRVAINSFIVAGVKS
jgi:hypothetical protein